jgi:transposase
MDARKNSREELTQRREQVVALFNMGVPVMSIVKQTDLSWSTVNNAITLANSQASLMPSSRGRKKGTGKVLTPLQEEEICKIICSRRPWQVGLKEIWWNRKVVAKLLETKYGVTLSNRGLGMYLRQWGMVLEKNPCTKSVLDWLDTHFEDIQIRAKEDRAIVYWMSYTKQQNLVAFTNNQGKFNWVIAKSFDDQKQINLLHDVIKSSQRKVFLILCDSSMCKKLTVVNWLNQNTNQIECFPPNSISTSRTTRQTPTPLQQ